MLDHLDRLAEQVGALAAQVAAVDPATPVAACPGWTVRDLVSHVVAVHRWAVAALDSDGPPPSPPAEPAGDLAAWYAEAAADLVRALRDRPAGAPAWTMDRADPTAGFWRRRQLHEVVVHRHDLAVCAGDGTAAAYALDDELAVDGIAEVVDVLLPRQLRLGRTAAGDRGLRLRAAGRSWLLGDEPAEVVEAPAGDLLLRLWGRGEPLPGGWSALTP